MFFTFRYYILNLITTVLWFETIQASSSSSHLLPCTQTGSLEQIKNYLQRPDFSKALTAKNLFSDYWMNPVIFWENVNKIDNLCTSEEGKYLQIYCHNWPSGPINVNQYKMERFWNDWSVKTDYLYKWNNFGTSLARVVHGWSFKTVPALHYCTRVFPLPGNGNEFVVNYTRIEEILENLFTSSKQVDDEYSLNFGPEILDRIKQDKNGDIIKSLKSGFVACFLLYFTFL